MDPSDFADRFPAHLNPGVKAKRKCRRPTGELSWASSFMRQRSRQLQRVKVVVFGAGMIGSALIRKLIAERPLLSQLHAANYHITCAVDSSGFLFSGDNFGRGAHIGDGVLLKALERKQKLKEPLRVFPDVGYYLTDFERLKTNLLDSGTIAVDCTSQPLGHANTKLSLALAEHSAKGGAVVFANKSNCAHCFDAFDSSVSRLHRVGFAPTLVGGGSVAHAISAALSEEMSLCGGHSSVFGVRGILSPFWNSLLTRFTDALAANKRVRFSDLVLSEHSDGYTATSDPRNDLFGFDLEVTLRIFAKLLAFENSDAANVSSDLMSLYPTDLTQFKGNIEKFMNELRTADAFIEERLTEVMHESGGNWDTHCLRLVSALNCETDSLSCVLTAVGRESRFGQCKGHSVCCEMISEIHDTDNPLFIQGAAGGEQLMVASIIAEFKRLSALLANG